MSGRRQDLLSTGGQRTPATSPHKRPSLGNKADRRASDASSDTIPANRPGSRRASPDRQSGEKVRVVIRCRPAHALESPGAVQIDTVNNRITLQRGDDGSNTFTYDRVLRLDAPQGDVYEAAAHEVVDDVLNGFNGTIMAYGQTGAGKTYTLSSTEEHAIGIMPRACLQVFNRIGQHPEQQYTVLMSIVQLYTERIQDLLRPKQDDLNIREGDDGVYVEGVHQAHVHSPKDCLELLQRADLNRAIASTALNAVSSRSHVIVMLTVVRHHSLGLPGQQDGRARVGRLFMVDLAGSERLKKSLSTGERAAEAKNINLSLTMLGLCIKARAEVNSTHVPFRNSKLTRLLQDSLGGNAKTSLVIAATEATEHVNETLDSLRFGDRAMKVSTRARVNEVNIADMHLPEGSDNGSEHQDDGTDAQQANGGKHEAVLSALLKEQQQRQAEHEQALAAERSTRRELEQQLHLRQQQHQAETKRLESELFHRDRQLSVMSDSHAALKEQAQHAQQQSHQLQQAKKDVQREKEQQQMRLQRQMQEERRVAVASQQQIIDELRNRLSEAESAQHSSASEVQALKDQCLQQEEQLRREQHAAVSEQKRIITGLQQQLDAAEAARQRSAAEVEAAQQRSSRQQAQIAELEAERKQIVTKIEQLRKDHSSASSEASRLTSGQATLSKEKQRLEADRASLRQDIASLQDMLLGLENERDTLSSERAALEEERDQLAESQGQLASECETLREECGVLRPKVAELEQKLNSETAAAKRRHARAESFREQLEATRKHMASLQKQLTEANATNATLQQTMEQRQRENDAACRIQRKLRQRTLARLLSQKTRGDEALQRLQEAHVDLQGSNQVLSRAHAQQLLATGHRLVMQAVHTMHDARAEIRAQFLLAKTDLNKRRHMENKVREVTSPIGTPLGTPRSFTLSSTAASTPFMSATSSMSFTSTATTPRGGGYADSLSGTPRRTPRGQALTFASPLGRPATPLVSTPSQAMFRQQELGTPRATETPRN